MSRPQNILSMLVRELAKPLAVRPRVWALVSLSLLYVLPAQATDASHEFLGLYSFCAKLHCVDGAYPAAYLIINSRGDLYGTTVKGGQNNKGTVFKLSPDGTETVLHSFEGGNDGAGPVAGVVADASGNLYGTTENGGGTGCDSQTGCGTVYKIGPDGTEVVLHAFCRDGRCRDGAYPVAGLILDKSGNLYGTTSQGGQNRCAVLGTEIGCGTVFKLAPDGQETVLHAFCPHGNCKDGADPQGGLATDADGNLYGTTSLGGACGAGTVFVVAPDGTESVLHSFEVAGVTICDSTMGDNGSGGFPAAGLLLDNANNLYGTATQSYSCSLFEMCGGAVFRLTHAGSFAIIGNGNHPESVPIRDRAGNLYVTNMEGGNGCNFIAGCGSVFELTTTGEEIQLHSFPGGGKFPKAGLALDAYGNLYGTAFAGGTNHHGTVFILRK